MALVEKITWSVPADIPEVEILSVENNQRPWCVLHETYTICTIDNFVDEVGRTVAVGEAEYTYRRKLHSNPAHSLMLLEPGEIHCNTKAPPPLNFFVALFNTKLVDRIAVESGLKANPHFKQAAISDPGVYQAFMRFHTSLAEDSTLLHKQSLMVNCIGQLLSGHCERNLRRPLDADQRRLRWTRDFIEQHFSEKISLDQLANIAGLSRFHFLRAFAREFGLPPHRYQLSLRLERVRLLLKVGTPMHLIEAGFADQSHLIRRFKRAWGVTPSRYAAMVGGKPQQPVAIYEAIQQ